MNEVISHFCGTIRRLDNINGSLLLRFVSRFNANPNKSTTNFLNETGSEVSVEMQRSETHLMKNTRGLASPEYCFIMQFWPKDR